MTDELINARGVRLRAAPIFPSLLDEGRVGGGWDLKLPRFGRPLFLQFKLADCLQSRRAKEHRSGDLRVPYFRMHLRPGRISRQHDLLLTLEKSGERVYYVAPQFHTMDELNTAYLAREIRPRSFWLKPSSVGLIRDGGNHYVAFESGRRWLFCSEPTRGEASADFETLERELLHDLEELSHDRLERLAAAVRAAVGHDNRLLPHVIDGLLTDAKAQPSLHQAAFLAQFFLDAQLFVVSTVAEFEMANPGPSAPT